MSFDKLLAVLESDAQALGLTPSAKLMWTSLAKFDNDEWGYGWPTVRTLAVMVGVSERQARYILRALETKGLIKRAPGMRSDGGQSSNHYRINVPVESRRSSSTRKPTAASPCGELPGDPEADFTASRQSESQGLRIVPPGSGESDRTPPLNSASPINKSPKRSEESVEQTAEGAVELGLSPRILSALGPFRRVIRSRPELTGEYLTLIACRGEEAVLEAVGDLVRRRNERPFPSAIARWLDAPRMGVEERRIQALQARYREGRSSEVVESAKLVRPETA